MIVIVIAANRSCRQICLVPISIICVRDCKPCGPSGNKSIQEPILFRSADAESFPSMILSEFYKGSPGLSPSLFLRIVNGGFISSIFYSPSLFSNSTDILYISVRLLAPYKSIFALSPESNLSVSAGSRRRTGKRFWIQNRFDLRIVSSSVMSVLLWNLFPRIVARTTVRWTTMYMANSYCSRQTSIWIQHRVTRDSCLRFFLGKIDNGAFSFKERLKIKTILQRERNRLYRCWKSYSISMRAMLL